MWYSDYQYSQHFELTTVKIFLNLFYPAIYVHENISLVNDLKITSKLRHASLKRKALSYVAAMLLSYLEG